MSDADDDLARLLIEENLARTEYIAIENLRRELVASIDRFREEALSLMRDEFARLRDAITASKRSS